MSEVACGSQRRAHEDNTRFARQLPSGSHSDYSITALDNSGTPDLLSAS